MVRRQWPHSRHGAHDGLNNATRPAAKSQPGYFQPPAATLIRASNSNPFPSPRPQLRKSQRPTSDANRLPIFTISLSNSSRCSRSVRCRYATPRHPPHRTAPLCKTFFPFQRKNIYRRRIRATVCRSQMLDFECQVISPPVRYLRGIRIARLRNLTSCRVDCSIHQRTTTATTCKFSPSTRRSPRNHPLCHSLPVLLCPTFYILPTVLAPRLPT